MPYPGLTFAIMVGVAIGTAIYYYFNQENDYGQNAHQYDNFNNQYSGYNSWNDTRSSTTSLPRRRRRNSSEKCSICLEDILAKQSKMFIECGHEFHVHCINIWLKEQKNCPNCRQAVNFGG